MLFQVQIAAAEGPATLLIDAEDERAARKAVGLPDSKIVEARPAPLNGALTPGAAKKPTLMQQITLLEQIAESGRRGEPATGAFDYFFERYPHLATLRAHVDRTPTVSGKLRLLRCERIATLMADVGQNANRLTECLAAAAESLSRYEKARRGLVSGLLPGVMSLGAGVAVLFLFPVIIRDTIMGMMKDSASGKPKEMEPLTEVLLAIPEVGPWIIAGLVGLAAFCWVNRETVWPRLAKLPIFATINDLILALRSIDFVSALMPLDNGGVGHERALELISSGFDGSAKACVERIREKTRQGRQLSMSLSSDDWHMTLVHNLRNFEPSAPENRRRIMTRIIERLTVDIESNTTMLARVSATGGMILGIGTLVLVAIGGFLPMVTSASAL